ncbi:MAG: DUF5683 domain-containing protein [bacterium]
MRFRNLIVLLVMIFFGVNICSPYAYARRRPNVSKPVEEVAEEYEEKVYEDEEYEEEESGEELTGKDLEKYLYHEEPLKEEAKEEEKDEEETGFSAWTPKNAALRSLMLPGWGQFFNEQPTKGYIFAGTEIILLGTTLVMYNQANSTYDDYENGKATYDDYSKKLDTVNMVVGVMAAVWIYNVIDAYVNASYEEEVSLLPKDGFAMEVKNTEQVSLLYRKKF